MNNFDPLSSLEDSSLRPGTYPALASGNESKVVQGAKTYTFKFEIYVKGFNVPDVIAVNSDGRVRSKVLGEQEIKQNIDQQSESVSPSLQPGYYPAQASGYISRAIHDGIAHTFKFMNGVRGINIPDTITVSADGSITSIVLGKSIGTAK